jgi:hypothetical protein
MKHIVLSDHTADHLNQKEIERQRKYEAALKAYEVNCRNADMEYEEAVKAYARAVRKRQQDIDIIKTKRKEAWQQRAWWQTVKYIFALLFAAFSEKPNMPKKPRKPYSPVKESSDEDDHRWESGRAGEQQVLDFLQGQINCDMVLLSGYKNRKGEIDKILVGAEGIFAIEIKNINGNIYCDGDKWWKDKYDRYGNMVNWDTPITEKKGRSPSQQLNEPADMLQTFLKRTLPSCQIYRVVVFTHESSKLKDLNKLTVNEVVTLENWDLKNTFNNSNSKLTKSEIERAAKKIEQDHCYMNNRLGNNQSREPIKRMSNNCVNTDAK